MEVIKEGTYMIPPHFAVKYRRHILVVSRRTKGSKAWCSECVHNIVAPTSSTLRPTQVCELMPKRIITKGDKEIQLYYARHKDSKPCDNFVPRENWG